MEALSLTKNWNVAKQLLGDEFWQKTLSSAIDFFICNRGKDELLEVVFDAIGTVACPDAIVTSVSYLNFITDFPFHGCIFCLDFPLLRRNITLLKSNTWL